MPALRVPRHSVEHELQLLGAVCEQHHVIRIHEQWDGDGTTGRTHTEPALRQFSGEFVDENVVQSRGVDRALRHARPALELGGDAVVHDHRATNRGIRRTEHAQCFTAHTDTQQTVPQAVAPHAVVRFGHVQERHEKGAVTLKTVGGEFIESEEVVVCAVPCPEPGLKAGQQAAAFKTRRESRVQNRSEQLRLS